MMTILPVLLLAAAFILFSRKFRLTDEKMAEIARVLHHE